MKAIFTVLVCIFSTSMSIKAQQLDSIVEHPYFLGTKEERTVIYFKYNNDEQLIQKYNYNYVPFILDTVELFNYSYDINGNVDTETKRVNNFGQSPNITKREYSYNNLNQKENEEVSQKNMTTLQWEKITKHTYTYNASNKLSTTTDYSWNDQTSAWDTISRDHYSYNNLDSITSIETEAKAVSNGSWWISKKTTYSYDSQNRIDEKMTVSTIHPSVALSIESKEVYSYNQNITTKEVFEISTQTSLLELTDRYIYEYSGDILIRSEWFYKSTDGSIQLIKEIFYYYKPITTDIAKNLTKRITLSPNPISAEGFLTFSQPILDGTMTIINMKGNVVKNENLQNAINISLSGISSGIYFVQIKENNNRQAQTYKLVVL